MTAHAKSEFALFVLFLLVFGYTFWEIYRRSKGTEDKKGAVMVKVTREDKRQAWILIGSFENNLDYHEVYAEEIAFSVAAEREGEMEGE